VRNDAHVGAICIVLVVGWWTEWCQEILCLAIIISHRFRHDETTPGFVALSKWRLAPLPPGFILASVSSCGPQGGSREPGRSNACDVRLRERSPAGRSNRELVGRSVALSPGPGH